MATLEFTIKQEGYLSMKKHFLNLRDTERVNTYNSKRYGF